MPEYASNRQSSAITEHCSHKQSPEPSKTPPKFSAKPAKISEKDRVALLNRLDSTDAPFRVDMIPLSRKRKRSGTRLQVQDDLFEERLAVKYKVEPRKDWESLRRYKRFTVGSESIATGDFILVSHSITEDPVFDSLSDWKAKVLEVRALDMEHVYVCVSWLNRPEDLKGGRQVHHGKYELVPTNQMDVIDAQAVNGTFELKHYEQLKDNDRKNASGKDRYFWRQTFDLATKSLSTLS